MALAAIWSFGALFVWRSLMILPLGLVATEYKLTALIIGYVVSTWLVIKLDGKLFPNRTFEMRVWPERPHWLIFAFIAGAGFTVVGSEVGNVGMKMLGNTIPYTPDQGPEPSVWMSAVLGSIVHPICFGLIVFSVTLRTFLNWTKPWQAIVLTCILASLGAPVAQTAQLMFIAALPAWLFIQTKSISLAICTYLPASLLPLLEALDMKPNIIGFDEIDPNRIVQQPTWFTLLGAAITIVGMWPLQRAIEANADTP